MIATITRWLRQPLARAAYAAGNWLNSDGLLGQPWRPGSTK